jgi:hypothetical protein
VIAPVRLLIGVGLIGIGLAGLAACFSSQSCTSSPQAGGFPKAPANHSLEAQFKFIAAGVPYEKAAGVASLAELLGSKGVEPLSDPLTLMRFYTAREENVPAAALMYQEACAWRASYSIDSLMYKHGAGEHYAVNGNRLGEPTSWQWRRTVSSVGAKLASQYGFFGRLLAIAPDGGPIAIWRVPDLDGIKRAGLEKVLQDAFLAHMEDLLQAGRSESMKRKKLVRARIIIDANGVGTAVLRHREVFTPLIQMMKKYFPEVSASVSIVRAPWIFSTIFQAVSPLLTPVMKRKVCIIGQSFQSKLQEHSTVPLDCLPSFLGGRAGNCKDELCAALKVPEVLGVASTKSVEEDTCVCIRKVLWDSHKMDVPMCCVR